MLKQEWLELLKNKVVLVKFTKKSGEERTMKCTLMAEYLPKIDAADPEESVRTVTSNPDVVNVWDVEKSGWRSFRIDTVTSTDLVRD